MKRVEEMLSEMRAGGGLGEASVEAAAEMLLDAGVGDDEKAELLTALSEKGETAEEIAGFVRVFLGHAVRVPLELEGLDRPALDVCGTGGDKLDLFNVSTASMFVLAGGGAAVVKHGNRGITSKSGGADVLEALGVRIDLPPERFAESVRRHGAGFMLAPHYHPAFKAVAGVRRRLAAAGVRTVFNVIGPLLNPLQPPYQLVGVYDGSLPPVYADILGRLGRKRAWVVHGRTADGRGMDEVSTLGVTEVVAVEGGRLTATTLGGPEHPARVEELVGGDAAHNAALLEGILTGKDRGPRREIVVMNAAAAFQVAGLETTWEGGRARAEETIDSGRAAGVLAALRAFA